MTHMFIIGLSQVETVMMSSEFVSPQNNKQKQSGVTSLKDDRPLQVNNNLSPFLLSLLFIVCFLFFLNPCRVY